jgi:hypothetical protein
MTPIQKEIFDSIGRFIAETGATSCNAADYTSIPGFVCCAWMDLHDDIDYGVTKEKPHFHLKPVWWDEDARLLHQYRRKWLSTPLSPEVVRINAARAHGLAPSKIADELVRLNHPNFPEFREWEDQATFRGRSWDSGDPIRIVWLWNDVKKGEFYSNDSRSPRFKDESEILKYIRKEFKWHMEQSS